MFSTLEMFFVLGSMSSMFIVMLAVKTEEKSGHENFKRMFFSYEFNNNETK